MPTPEAIAYQAAIISAGGTISPTQFNAVDTFVQTGTTAGWFSKIVDCCPFLGATLTAALVKLVTAPGAGASYVNHGVSTYTESGGVSVAANFTAYLSTGVIPADQGLTEANLSVCFGSLITPTFSGQALIGADQSNGADIAVVEVVPYGGFGNRAELNLTRCYAGAFSYGSSSTRSAMDGIRTLDLSTNTHADTLPDEIEIFRVTKFGTHYPTITGQVGFFCVGADLTATELRSLTAAVRQLHLSARSITVTTREVFLGDSITLGQGIADKANTWAELVRADRDSDMTNLGFPGTTFLDVAASGTHAGENRYVGTDAFPITTFFCMMGSNDIVVADGTTNGDAVVLASYRTKLALMADTLQGQGARVVIVSIPYTTRGNQTKVLAWVDAALGAATDAGATGVDVCRPMIASLDPGQYLIDDVHPNETGHALIASLVLDAMAAAGATFQSAWASGANAVL